MILEAIYEGQFQDCSHGFRRKFLKAGYLEDWTFHNTFSGTPQGGIVSPILVNIYLDRLEEFMMGIHPEI